MKGVAPFQTSRRRRPGKVQAGDDSDSALGTRQERVAGTWADAIIPTTLTMTRAAAEIQNLFLSSSRYAVVGASKDQSKYGTKVRGMIY